MANTVSFGKSVKTPAPGDLNTGLTSPTSDFMTQVFGGPPGSLTANCSEVNNAKLKAAIVTSSVGPFRVTGHRAAVQSLQAIFAEVKAKDPALYGAVKTAGMLCCRAIRGSASHFSNHSWGMAVDCYFGDSVDEMGDGETQAGLLALYPTFHAHKWFWGAGFHTREDSMHFEASEELIRDWQKAGIV